MNDPASLQNLHDLATPPPVPWWPPAPGWYLLMGLAAVALAFLVFRALRRYRRNRYRRDALRELETLRAAGANASPAALPALLKRTALSAWPRDAVAALSGREWHAFLDRTAGGSRFADGAGVTLDALAYGSAAEVDSGELAALWDAAGHWLRQHRPPGEGA